MTKTAAGASPVDCHVRPLVDRLHDCAQGIGLGAEGMSWSPDQELLREAAAEIERYKPLMQAVEWILEDGHMNQEHLARLRAAWEAA